MADELLVAQAEWLPQYTNAIAEARERMAGGKLIPTKPYKGAARLRTKTLEELRQEREASA